MNNARLALLLLATVLALSACGNKGPLVLPEKPGDTATPVEGTAPADTDATPTDATPAEAAPTEAAPTEAAPADAVPTDTVPTDEVPVTVPEEGADAPASPEPMPQDDGN